MFTILGRMPYRLTLGAMRDAIRAGQLSPQVLVDAHIRQIETVNPKINAFALQFLEEAREQARDPQPGPLQGIPVTIKDSFDVAGYPTRAGSRLLPSTPAANDSYAAKRLKQAGAILLGKTNCPEFLMSYETDNYLTGRTNNPLDLERTPGGSSGGEAAAIAAFCSAGGVGSDGGGSIRIPAHCCGIVGLKPTPGRIPGSGHVPRISHPGGLLTVAGPMARTVQDVKILFDVLKGYDEGDPFSVPMQPAEASYEGLRVGIMEQFYGVPVQDAAREAVHKAARVLQELRIPTEPFSPKGLERAPNGWWFAFGEMTAPILRELIAGRESEVHPLGTESINTVPQDRNVTGKEVVEQFAIRDRMRASLLRQMETYRVLLMPACAVPAWRHGERKWPTPQKPVRQFEAMMLETPWNLLGLPSLVLPFHQTEEGLPFGVQLVGRPYEEDLLLALGEQLEASRVPQLAGLSAQTKQD